MNNEWIKRTDVSRNQLHPIAQSLGVSLFYASLLYARGITTVEQARAYFNPDINDLHDPFLMMDMEKAVERLSAARDRQQRVLVYGDYDVDGTTSIACLYGFLEPHFEHLEYYVPDREKEGYGLSEAGVAYAIESKVEVLVTVDCGIRSMDLIERAQANGIDVIVCDHHETGSDLPNAVAVLDPKRKDCTYPFDELSACGVVFKLIQALCMAWGLNEEVADDYLDLVAVSIASDLVPIVGENRILAHAGLEKLRTNPSPGLRTILNHFVQGPTVDISNVVFAIGPRINAAGRLASAKVAVQLLLADENVDVSGLARGLDELNKTRRSLDTIITQEALVQIRQDDHPNRKTTLVFGRNWHKGVVGIVASRLLERHYRPTIVLTESNGKIVGSARSIEGFNIHEALITCEPYLEQFGGHAFAAGMTLLPENLEQFRDAFEASASHLTEEQLVRKLPYDAEIELKAVTMEFWQTLNRFAPFGPGNMKPVFLLRNLADTGNARTMGKGNIHLKLNVVQNGDLNTIIAATAFSMGDWYDKLKNGQRFDMLCTLELNHFNGNTTVELMVQDIREAKPYSSV